MFKTRKIKGDAFKNDHLEPELLFKFQRKKIAMPRLIKKTGGITCHGEDVISIVLDFANKKAAPARKKKYPKPRYRFSKDGLRILIFNIKNQAQYDGAYANGQKGRYYRFFGAFHGFILTQMQLSLNQIRC